MNQSIQPKSGLLTIQSRDNHHILIIKRGVPFQNILNPLFIVLDINPLNPCHHNLSSNLSLIPANIFLPKQELSVQIRQLDDIHVDYVDVFEAHEAAVFEDFAAQASRTHDQDAHQGREHRFCGWAGLEQRVLESRRLQ